MKHICNQDIEIINTSPQSGSSHSSIAWPWCIGQHVYSTDSTWWAAALMVQCWKLLKHATVSRADCSCYITSMQFCTASCITLDESILLVTRKYRKQQVQRPCHYAAQGDTGKGMLLMYCYHLAQALLVWNAIGRKLSSRNYTVLSQHTAVLSAWQHSVLRPYQKHCMSNLMHQSMSCAVHQAAAWLLVVETEW